MEWIDRLEAATRYGTPHRELDRSGTEFVPGTSLPADFKELCRRVPGGAFGDYLVPLGAQDAVETLAGNHASLLSLVRANPDNLALFQPHGLLEGDGTGLLRWGHSYIEDEYY
ncbi:hypothetical protein [Actinacidiphila paucisporea]|uniref:SMI1/KNR4 family protein n=1 Tax=Actinacidiphila paucisporea TaxID=310782 RepID=A0A1M7QZK0_9ACTN|nr:hypothetical protein [Actinacidiphila paucisporea]SHN37647.1 hypothetical protein SAMN05216499_1553 [Actinacidiphila paucisporea]